MTDCKFQNLFQFKSQIHKSSSFMNVTGNGKYTTNLNKHTISIDVYLFVCGCVWNWCADWVYWPRTISMDVYLFVCGCVWNWCADWVYCVWLCVKLVCRLGLLTTHYFNGCLFVCVWLCVWNWCADSDWVVNFDWLFDIRHLFTVPFLSGNWKWRSIWSHMERIGMPKMCVCFFMKWKWKKIKLNWIFVFIFIYWFFFFSLFHHWFYWFWLILPFFNSFFSLCRNL